MGVTSAVAEVEASGEETLTVGVAVPVLAIPEASGAAVEGVGFVTTEARGAADAHAVVDVASGAGVCDFLAEGLLLPWLGCAPPELAPPVVGVALPLTALPLTALPLLASVPLPSGPAPPCAGPLPPFSEVLAWRIAWRTG